jgi:hypothetical protein
MESVARAAQSQACHPPSRGLSARTNQDALKQQDVYFSYNLISSIFIKVETCRIRKVGKR